MVKKLNGYNEAIQDTSCQRHKHKRGKGASRTYKIGHYAPYSFRWELHGMHQFSVGATSFK